MYLSASRIKTFATCSWTYFLIYEKGFRDLDESNDGAKRGTICHLILEMLIRQKHQHYIKKVLKGGCYKIPQIKRLILKHAKVLGVDDKENLKLIDGFIITGLKSDFFCDGWKLEKAEEEFNIEKDTYKVRGFIDKHATQLDKSKARIDDYKTSKNKFTGKDAEFNIQALMYALALYEKYKTETVEVNFVFLKFPRQPLQTFRFSAQHIKGFEFYLERIYSFLSTFDAKKATSNFARNNECWRLCGKTQTSTKKDGSPSWLCPWKYPFIYYEAKVDGRDRKSKSRQSLIDLGVNESDIVERYYKGCPAWDVAKNYQKSP